MKKRCDFDIHLNDFETKEAFQLGEWVTGQIIIQPTEAFEAEEIGYRLVAETTTEKESKTSKIIYSKTLAKGIDLSADEELKYDIRFKNDTIESNLRNDIKARKDNDGFYPRRNLKVLLKVEAFILVAQMNKFNNFISESRPVVFVGENGKYKVVSKTIQLEMEEILVLLGLFILVPLFIYFSPTINLVLYLLATLGFVIILVTLNYFFRKKYLGEVSALFQNKGDDHFLLTLKNSKNWRHIKNLSVHYDIYESYLPYLDSSNRQINTIFKSEKKEITNPLNLAQIEFEFPRNMPATTMIHPDGIYWKIVVEAESDVGKKFIYKRKFEVKKENL